jgi:hypothetical protein
VAMRTPARHSYYRLRSPFVRPAIGSATRRTPAKLCRLPSVAPPIPLNRRTPPHRFCGQCPVPRSEWCPALLALPGPPARARQYPALSEASYPSLLRWLLRTMVRQLSRLLVPRLERGRSQSNIQYLITRQRRRLETADCDGRYAEDFSQWPTVTSSQPTFR